ncbi:LacI family DNA-binding transcriptional regulator [Cognatishimia sp. WU-CL00825]|uniref:LacI family DNA-binding transcriptional regulator n=1 Tax=Cognatishimia sp. WU-CL00825 TaxID=3127658 RepID=UPI00310BB204
MAVTLKDVAERAGVSRSAVSRTYTEGASVSKHTRRKVEKAANELGYSPNALASSLTTGRTKLIGLVSNNFHNPIFLQVFDLFTKGLQDRGLRPLLVNLTDEVNPENSVRMLRAYSVDAVIVASSTLPESFAEGFRDAGVPVVHSFGRHVASPKVNVLGINNIEAGRMAAQSLIARGYDDVAFLGGPKSATSTQDRYKGFVDEVAQHPQVKLSSSFAADYTFDAGRAEMTRLLKAKPAQAYFCGDDVLSIGALSAVQSAGLNVPDDIGLLGLNDMEMARWENINLTTIHNPFRQIIASSIELIESMLKDDTRYPEARLFACHIVERGTLRPLP